MSNKENKNPKEWRRARWAGVIGLGNRLAELLKIKPFLMRQRESKEANRKWKMLKTFTENL